MHPLLQPVFPTKLAIASGALWAAWMVGAVFVQLDQKNAPAPAAIDPPKPFAVLIRTVPITPELAFEQRWQAPAPAMQQARMAEDAQTKPDQSKQSQISPRHAARHADRVCGSNPSLYQHILTNVKPERDQNRRSVRKQNWWLFGENAPTLRRGTQGLKRFIGTCRTAKHRIFVFVPANYIVDAKIVGIALDDAFHLALLTSRIHQLWAFRTGGWLGVGNDSNYNHAVCFNRFPFPSDVAESSKALIRVEGESLDALRKKILKENPDLTLTNLYNVLEKVRTNVKLEDAEREVHDRGLVSLLRKHHDEIDKLIAEAYDWPVSLTEEEVLTRLVILNRERAAEEERGVVKWLRPELQAPGEIGVPMPTFDLGEIVLAKTSAALTLWPKSLPDQVTAISKILAAAPKPLSPRDVARIFDGKRASTIEPVLKALTAIGQARQLADGRYAA